MSSSTYWWDEPDVPKLEVQLPEDQEILNYLLGPDGRVISYVVDKRHVEFGFQVPSRPPDRRVRASKRLDALH